MGLVRYSFHEQVRDVVGSQGPRVPLPWKGELRLTDSSLITEVVVFTYI